MLPSPHQFFSSGISAGNNYLPSGAGLIQGGYGFTQNLTAYLGATTGANSTPVVNGQQLPSCAVAPAPCCQTAGESLQCCQQLYYATVDVQYMGVATVTPRIYKIYTYDVCLQQLVDVQTFPLLTVIINLVMGVPDAITWDDGCYFCASNGASCVPYSLLSASWAPAPASTGIVSCYTDMATCYGSATPTPTVTPTPSTGATPSNSPNGTITSNPCDLQIFVSWSGKDSAGNYLTSQNKRLSRFRQFGTASIQQSAINIGTAGLNAITGAVNPNSLFPGT